MSLYLSKCIVTLNNNNPFKRGRYTKGNEPVMVGQILYDSIYMRYWE